MFVQVDAWDLSLYKNLVYYKKLLITYLLIDNSYNKYKKNVIYFSKKSLKFQTTVYFDVIFCELFIELLASDYLCEEFEIIN